ncbi:uncharacterized protein LOC141889038 isoform X2 [Acropora palmata]|uniref:uncharacterized protein LOC141889038 isoform X2 n=1 Tax=Acropora palmata TaxID=6131 RepID=UPI003DA0BF7A
MGDKRDDAYNKLRLYLDKVGREKSEHQVDKSGTTILKPSKPKDFEGIKGLTLYDRDDRELFNEWMVDTPNRTALRIQAEGNSPVPPRLMGRYFHGAMSNEIAHLDSAGGSQNKAPEEERLSRWFNCVHKFLKDNFKVSLLPAIKEVPLRGFMYPKDEDFLPDLNCWNGRADAIGLLEGEDDYKYVIVKWKTAATTLNAFWKNKRSGDSFTQCFVYTRLLKLHLSLDYYPPILIVPFNSEREYMHPRLFTDYPDQFKEAIEKYQWSTNPPQRFKKESPLKDKVKEAQSTVQQSQLNEEFAIEYDDFKVTALRKLVREAVMSDGRANPNWGEPASRPCWWPKNIPFEDVNYYKTKPRREQLLAILNAFKEWKDPGAQSTVQQSQLNEEFAIEYEDFRVEGLTKLVTEAVMSDGRANPNWGEPASRPCWWPKNIPFEDVNNHTRQEFLDILNAFKEWKDPGGVSADTDDSIKMTEYKTTKLPGLCLAFGKGQFWIATAQSTVQLDEEFAIEYDDFKVTALRKLVREAVMSDGRANPNWGEPASRPCWWPRNIPFEDVNYYETKPRREQLLAILNAFKEWKDPDGEAADSDCN